MDALVLLHLPHADTVLQFDQLLLQLVNVILVPPIPTYLRLNSLVLEGVNAQVYLIPIRVTSAKEPYVSDGVTWVLTEVKEGGGIKVVGIGGGAAGTKPMDSGVVSILHFSKLGWPDVPVRATDWHGDILLA
jgi:hypothetical protein